MLVSASAWVIISAASTSTALVAHESHSSPALPHYDWPEGIPKVIHFCYKHENIPGFVKEAWSSLNPGFAIQVHGDASCHRFLLEHYGSEIAGFYARVPHGPIRACIWRIFCAPSARARPRARASPAIYIHTRRHAHALDGTTSCTTGHCAYPLHATQTCTCTAACTLTWTWRRWPGCSRLSSPPTRS